MLTVAQSVKTNDVMHFAIFTLFLTALSLILSLLFLAPQLAQCTPLIWYFDGLDWLVKY